MKIKSTTKEELFRSSAAGDQQAFAEIFHLYKDQVYSYAMHFTRSVSVSEEITQDIFLKLWLNKENLSEVKQFEAYLYAITRNLCFDYLKKLAREQAMKQQWARNVKIAEDTVAETVICKEYEGLLSLAMEQLTPQQKKVYSLSFYQGLDCKSIAQSLHISRNTVKVHLAKSRSVVRDYLLAHMETAIILVLIFISGQRL